MGSQAPSAGVVAVVALVAVALVLLTLGVFWPATGYDFINFDDPDYVTHNPRVLGGLSLDGLRFAFNVGHTGNWIPLTWLSHMLDVSLFGVRPGAHHLHSVVLHALNVALLFAVLRLLLARAAPEDRGTPAVLACGFVAAVFAVHPLRLESVVWISERKDLLAGLFWMLTLLAYLRYTRRPGRVRMAGVAALFALGLMSKPMLISLPLVLCVLDVWPLGRLRHPGRGTSDQARRLLLEKLPLFALAAGSAVLTVLAQSRGGALSSVAAVPATRRVAGAVVGYAGYLGDLLWPTRRAVFYPFPPDGWPLAQVALSAAILLGISAAAIAWRRRFPWIAVGWLWYLISAAPVIGLVKIGQQAGADRYTYLPLLGPAAALTWGAVTLSGRLRLNGVIRAVGATALLLALIVSTRQQIGHWQDSRTLFSRALEVTEDNHVAHYSLSLEYERMGDLDAALLHGHEALRIYPQLYGAYLHVAEMHAERGEIDDAQFLLGLAMHQQPDNVLAYNSLGRVLLAGGRTIEAVSAFEEVIARAPGLAEAHHDLGVANEQLGRIEAAQANYARAARLDPDYFDAWFDGGRLASSRGRALDARAALERAVALRPAEPGAISLLTLVLIELGEREAAEARYRDLVALGAPGAPQVRELLDRSAPGAPPG